MVHDKKMWLSINYFKCEYVFILNLIFFKRENETTSHELCQKCISQTVWNIRFLVPLGSREIGVNVSGFALNLHAEKSDSSRFFSVSANDKKKINYWSGQNAMQIKVKCYLFIFVFSIFILWKCLKERKVVQQFCGPSFKKWLVKWAFFVSLFIVTRGIDDENFMDSTMNSPMLLLR